MAIVGIETGGTSTRVAAMDSGRVTLLAQVPTTDPDATLGRIGDALRGVPAPDALGVAAFGPLDLATGALRATPKPGWSGFPLGDALGDMLGARATVDTDVNAAALAECRWGVARGLQDAAYVTIGTGLGVGVVHGGRAVHGLPHPEAGHMTVRRAAGDAFPGACPFHGDCLEGLVAAPAVRARMGKDGADLDAGERAHLVRMLAIPIADGLAGLVYACAPRRIVLGGGISQLDGLLGAVRAAFRARLAGYPGCPEHDDDAFIAPPALGQRAGIAGALLLAGARDVPEWPAG